MPTNLPPEYFEVDKRYRAAQTSAEKIALLEELISTIPKHKGTDHLRADLRRQLSRLKEEAQAKKKHGAHQSIYQVDKEGLVQVVLVGPTNVGKSSLLAALTHATPDVSPALYTTWKPIPGMMPIENIQVQLVDTPSLARDISEPGLFDLVRRADLVLLVVDLQADPLEQMEAALALLREHRIAPTQAKGMFAGQERMTFLPVIVVANKWDDESLDELFDVFCALFERECPVLPVSAATWRNFDVLKKWVYERLNIMRVYAKPPGKEPDLDKPFVLKKGSTIDDLAQKVHRDFYEKLKFARVWGSAAFDGQMVQRDYPLQEGDIVELKSY
jgi:hypothetical protein